MAERRNHLYYGDNLTILRERIPDDSVDLVYLDPPFNSNATYNVLFRSHDGEDSTAQIQAFDDTWHWSQQTEQLWLSMVGGGSPPRVADALTAMRNLLGTSDMNAYIVMMAARLVELHRVLKPTGSLYLHCDPTASHYLKVTLDAVFGPERFRNEVIWKRTAAHSSAKRFGPVHDVVLFYSRGPEFTWNQQYQDYDEAYLKSKYRHVDEAGRVYRLSDLTAAGTRRGSSGQPWRGFDPAASGNHWKFTTERLDELDGEGRIHWTKGGRGIPQFKRYLDEMKGVVLQDVWTDVDPINSRARERLGYPTQKPLTLLERIVAASSNEGDVVLDPFCGCGTTIDAAEQLHRQWIGIDVTYLAVDLIRKRLRHTYGDEIEATYVVHGVPADSDGARALFEENPFDFERWAVSLIDAQPNEKQVGDKGIDGRVRFYADRNHIGQALVSVKGGKTVTPSMVNEIAGTVSREQAELGILITLTEPTKGMRETADKSGSYTAPLTGQTYPKVQIISVGDLMAGKTPKMPTAILPYLKAKPRDPDQLTLGDD